jgi:hypothetical protein
VTSSTSNSDRFEPRWGYVWAVASLLVLVIAGSWELLVRDAGLGPAYVDNKVLWADTRHQLNKAGQDAIVLLGASRMQRAVDVETMSDQFGRPVFQLSIEGSSYIPLLENLAVDPRITGTVVVSIAPAFTFNRLLSQLDTGKQSTYVKYYSEQSYARRLEQRLTLFLQGRIAFRAFDAKLSTVIPQLIETGTMPGLDFKTIFRDRVVHINYDLMPAKQTDGAVAALYLEHAAPYTKAEFDPVVNYIATIARMLRQKGVDVYFVRLPSAGAVLALEGLFFPREQFWGVLEENVDATFVHYADYPELEGLLSDDGSHMDSANIVEFTELLSDVLARNQLQPGSD